MVKSNAVKKQEVISYYSRLGSRLGYRFVMRKSQHFGVYDELHRTEAAAQENFSIQFAEILKPRKGMNLLDAGCGQGVLAVYMAEKHHVNVTGITIVPLEVEKSRRFAKRAGVTPLTNFVVGDYHELPFPDNSFDCVYAVETLSHAYDLKKALQELHRVLKPGGSFVAAEYEFNRDDPQYGAQIGDVVEYAEKHVSLHGAKDFSKGSFLCLLKATGYESLHEHDWTARLMYSFRRLRAIGRPFKKIVQIFGKESEHPNATASSFYADGAEAGVFRYTIYVARKVKR